MKEWYFAYGSNMCLGRLKEYEVDPEEPGIPFQLNGWTLQFNKRSTDGSAKANLQQDAGSSTWGVLYAITQAELKRLNAREKGYSPVRVAIRIENGVEEHCWVHIADFVNDGLRPYSWYKRFILEGARAHGLPQDYIASLEVIEAAEDDDRDRDLRWRAISCDLK